MSTMDRLYSRGPKRRSTKVEQPPPQKKERSTTYTVSTMASLNSRPKRRSTKVEQPPQRNSSSSTRWFSLLPDEIVLNCLARISKSQYRSLSLLCKTFHSVLSSPELYTVRSQLGNTEPCLCIRPGPTTSKDNKQYAFDSKQGTWKELQGWFSDDNRRLITTGPWCVIENVKFSVSHRSLVWYDDSEGGGNWFSVKGLKDLYTNHHPNYPSTIQLAAGGGGSILLVVWDEPYSLELPVVGKTRKHVCKYRRFWCAVIKLEKRELEIWGEVVRSYALLTVPKSCKLLRCITL